MQRVLLPALLLALGISAFAYFKSPAPSVIQERNVRAHIEFLASDALQGRGSGTGYELIAAEYIAAQLRQFGLEPAGDVNANGQKSFLQTVTLQRQAFAAAPTLFGQINEKTREWTHGKEMVLMRATAADLSGPLQRVATGAIPERGAFVFWELSGNPKIQEIRQQMETFLNNGAAAVLFAEPPDWQERWARLAGRLPELPTRIDSSNATGTLIVLKADAAKELQQLPNGTRLQLKGQLAAATVKHTYNVIGELRGSDSKLAQQAISLSAHLDHLGVRRAVAGDSIYNGADDDASGVTAVLELARVLGAGPKPQRTVHFVLFGSEESGGYGAQYFIKHPLVPLNRFIADLQFEMIGRPDPKVAANTLWLTGFERSNLGSELAKQGALLVADPHPEQNFFQRSDNYALAKAGVIAHTVSSYGLHQEYHQPADDIAHIDFSHMTQAINSMVKPVQWLVNSNFIPTWVEGKKP